MTNTNAYMKEYMNKRYHSRRAEYLEMLGGKCVDCGSTNKLEFDHVDKSTKSFDIGKCLTHRRDKVIAELSKCVLRCKSCHKLKSDKEQSVEHGQGLTGKKNCLCELCRPLKNAYKNSR